MVVYFFGGNFQQFVLAELTAAAGAALLSEALEAWLLNAERKRYSPDIAKKRWHGTKSKTGLYRRVLSVFAIAGGGLAVWFTDDLATPWILGAVSLIVATMYGISFKDGEAKNGTSLEHSWREMFTSLTTAFKNRKMRDYLLLTLVLNASFQPLNMYWALLLEDGLGSMQHKELLITVYSVLLMLSIGWGSYLVRKIGEEAENRKRTLLYMLVGSLTVLLPSILGNWIVMALGFLVHDATRGAFLTMLHTERNDHIDDRNRTTLNSAFSSVRTLGGALGLQLFGLLGNLTSVETTWLVSGLLGLAVTVWWFFKSK
jgi:predicted MFS family arabinose efflux permease